MSRLTLRFSSPSRLPARSPRASSGRCSLAQSAMVLMGETPEPESGAFMRNLPEAKHTIDILAMLMCKTRGNLTTEESGMLENLLCELRLAYVKKQ